MPAEKFYAIERLSKRKVVLVGDGGDRVRVARSELPRRLEEGSVLRVPLDEAGGPDWAAARVDDVETARRRSEAERLVEKLRRSDPRSDSEI